MIHQHTLKFIAETSRSERIFAQLQSMSSKYVFIAMVVLTDIHKLLDIPVSKRQRFILLPLAGLSDSLLVRV